MIASNVSFQSSSNIGEFSKDVRLLAALEETESDGDKLLDAARKLAGAFSDLLNAAQPGSNEVSGIVNSEINKVLTLILPLCPIAHMLHMTSHEQLPIKTKFLFSFFSKY